MRYDKNLRMNETIVFLPKKSIEFIDYGMQKIVFFPFNNSNFYNWVILSKIQELFSKKTSKKTNKLS